MATHFAISYLDQIINVDADTNIVLPNPNAGGGPLAMGARFTVADNLGHGSGANITITGPVAGSTSGTSITTNYGSVIFTWTGATFVQK